MPSVASLLKFGITELKESDSKNIDAQILLSHALDKDRAWLYTWSKSNVSKPQQQQYQDFVRQRKSGLPIAYIIGHKEFYSLAFKVNSNTLIPRPETEKLVEIALENIKQHSQILELGTGSGIIAITLANKCKNCNITATDISDEALSIAKENAKVHKTNNIEFIQSNWYQKIDNKKFDLILSNPPYIAQTEKHLMSPDTKHEPSLALMSGEDGLDAIRVIIKDAQNYLKQNGKVILEHGFAQADKVQKIFKKYNFINIESFKDMQLQTRVTMACTKRD